jgi:F-type H+-transporting ATPase subunit delta
MSEIRIATRYSAALFNLARERKEIEQIHQDMSLFLKTCEENRDLVLLLKNPIIPPFKKEAIVKNIFEGKVEKVIMEFMSLVVRKNRAAFLVDISRQFHNRYNEFKGIEKATLTTPFQLSKALRGEFVEYIKGINNKEIELREEIDEDLIGGFVIRTEDQKIDTSIKSGLAKLKRQLTDTSYVKSTN